MNDLIGDLRPYSDLRTHSRALTSFEVAALCRESKRDARNVNELIVTV